MTRGWWAALPVTAVLFGLAGLVGAPDLGRRAVAALLVAGGIGGAALLRRRAPSPLVGTGEAVAPLAAGAAGALVAGAVVASLLLERETWLASILTAGFVLLGVAAGGLATWCLVREVDGTA